MTNGKVFAATAMVLIGIIWVGFSAGAGEAPFALPMGIGFKVPLAGFLSMDLNGQLRLEASAVIPGFSAPLVDFEGRVVAKLYPTAWEFSVSELLLRPFVGGGVAIFQAVGKWVPALVGLVGVETPALGLDWLVTILAEGSSTLLMSGAAPTLVLELSLGMRYSF